MTTPKELGLPTNAVVVRLISDEHSRQTAALVQRSESRRELFLKAWGDSRYSLLDAQFTAGWVVLDICWVGGINAIACLGGQPHAGGGIAQHACRVVSTESGLTSAVDLGGPNVRIVRLLGSSSKKGSFLGVVGSLAPDASKADVLHDAYAVCRIDATTKEVVELDGEIGPRF